MTSNDQPSHRVRERRAASLRAVGIKATPTGRARVLAHDACKWRDLDAADRPRTAKRMAAPKIVAGSGSPKIVGHHHENARDGLTDPAPRERQRGSLAHLDRRCPRDTRQQTEGQRRAIRVYRSFCPHVRAWAASAVVRSSPRCASAPVQRSLDYLVRETRGSHSGETRFAVTAGPSCPRTMQNVSDLGIAGKCALVGIRHGELYLKQLCICKPIPCRVILQQGEEHMRGIILSLVGQLRDFSHHLVKQRRHTTEYSKICLPNNSHVHSLRNRSPAVASRGQGRAQRGPTSGRTLDGANFSDGYPRGAHVMSGVAQLTSEFVSYFTEKTCVATAL